MRDYQRLTSQENSAIIEPLTAIVEDNVRLAKEWKDTGGYKSPQKDELRKKFEENNNKMREILKAEED